MVVAIPVAAGRLGEAEAGAQIHRVRAAGALTAFTNALVVSLFALIPGHNIGSAALVLAAGGLVFVTAALLSLIRRRQVRAGTLHDALFLLALIVTFVVPLIQGGEVIAQPGGTGAVNTIAVLVIVCFLIGIARAWELIGGPSIVLRREVTALVRSHQRSAGNPVDEESP